MTTVTVHKAEYGESVYLNREYIEKAMQELSGDAFKVWSYLYAKSEKDNETETHAPSYIMKVCNLDPEEYNNVFEEMRRLGYIRIEDGVYAFHACN